jgi:uncharacterized protein HemX
MAGKEHVANNSSAKAFGGIIALVALILGVYAMVEPMNQRIDFLERQIDTLEANMRLDDLRERKDESRLSAMGEKFMEVETQFSALRELATTSHENIEDRLDKIESHRYSEDDSAQWERIYALERETYGNIPPKRD